MSWCCQRENIKRDELRDLIAAWQTEEAVLEKLREVIQVASHLSHALRAPSFTDPELANLRLLSRDVVSGMHAVGCSIPSITPTPVV